MSKNIKEQIVKSINLQNNNFVDKDNITQSFQPRNAYLLPKIDGTHERFVTDDNNIISKQAGSSGGSGSIPLTSDNYYGLWSSSNQNFIDGLLYIKDSLTTNIGAIQLYNSEEGEYWRLSPDLDHNFFIQARDASTFFNVSTSSFSYNNLADYEAMFSSDDITSNRIYVLPDKDGTFIVKGYNDVAEVEGDVKANSYKFVLPQTIIPQPNMLIPKVDGSGLVWYNNNSVANDIAFVSDVANKLDKPTMTNNYYGLWDDTNKKFTNGNIRRGVNYHGREPLLINTDDNYNYWNDLQIGRLYDPTGYEFPDNRFLGFGFSDDFGNDNNLFIYVSGGYEPGMYPDNDPKSFYGMFTLNRDNLSLGNGSPEYGSNARIVTSTTTTKGTLRLEASHEINFVTSEYGFPKMLNYVKANNYWEFFKPIKGGNIKDGLRFTLPTSITPIPNTLIAKTDGSRPTWYDNNSIAHDLAFNKDLTNIVDGTTPPIFSRSANTLVNEVDSNGWPKQIAWVSEADKRLHVADTTTGQSHGTLDTRDLKTHGVADALIQFARGIYDGTHIINTGVFVSMQVSVNYGANPRQITLKFTIDSDANILTAKGYKLRINSTTRSSAQVDLDFATATLEGTTVLVFTFNDTAQMDHTTSVQSFEIYKEGVDESGVPSINWVNEYKANKTKVITITADTTISEIHNGNILHVTNSVSLIYAPTMPKDFNCTIKAFGNITVRHMSIAGISIFSDNGGFYQKNGAKVLVYCPQENYVVLDGPLTTT